MLTKGVLQILLILKYLCPPRLKWGSHCSNNLITKLRIHTFLYKILYFISFSPVSVSLLPANKALNSNGITGGVTKGAGHLYEVDAEQSNIQNIQDNKTQPEPNLITAVKFASSFLWKFTNYFCYHFKASTVFIV